MFRPKSWEIDFEKDEQMQKLVVGRSVMPYDEEENYEVKEIICDEKDGTQPAFIVYGPVDDESTLDEAYALVFEDEIVRKTSNVQLFKSVDDAKTFAKHLQSSNIGKYLQYEAYLRAFFKIAKNYVKEMTFKSELQLVCENLELYAERKDWPINSWLELAVDCGKQLPNVPEKHILYKETFERVETFNLRLGEDNPVTDALDFLPRDMIKADEKELKPEYDFELGCIDELYKAAQERLAYLNKNLKD